MGLNLFNISGHVMQTDVNNFLFNHFKHWYFQVSSNVLDKVMFSFQMLEVIRLEGHSLAQEDAFVSRDIHLLQVTPPTLVKC